MKSITTLKLKKNILVFVIIFLILSIAFCLRTYNINWDENYNFHPDERAIIMFTVNLSMPKSFSEFMDIDSPLNPKFFAYGNFPLYLMKLVGEAAAYFDPTLNDYGRIHIIGRYTSSLFDTFSVFLVFMIGKTIFSKRSGLISSIIYASTFFPIQLSHFYAVDTLLNFFLLFLFYLLIRLYKKPTFALVTFMGIIFGFALSTKISALAITPLILLVFLTLIVKKKIKINQGIASLFIFIFFTLASFLILQPYVLIDFNEFIKQTSLQTQMSKNPFVFPFTLQYVNKIPYIYEFKNIFFWGAGPFITSFSILGIILLLHMLYKRHLSSSKIMLLLYFFLYFSLFGKFAVGWMRYMLPAYPLMALFAGFSIIKILEFTKNNYFKNLTIAICLILSTIHTVIFISIYSKQNPRIVASTWINQNIPYGSTIAIEHWDDSLPINNFEKYKVLTLKLYDPDTNEKWNEIQNIIQQSDYIFIASNRLYAPLQKLTDCTNLPKDRCYKKTDEYYKKLFNGSLGFKKIKEFTNYPTIPLLNKPVIDDEADESFTVYDHPKIMIFKK